MKSKLYAIHGKLWQAFSAFMTIFKLDRAPTIQHVDNHIQSNSIYYENAFCKWQKQVVLSWYVFGDRLEEKWSLGIIAPFVLIYVKWKLERGILKALHRSLIFTTVIKSVSLHAFVSWKLRKVQKVKKETRTCNQVFLFVMR